MAGLSIESIEKMRHSLTGKKLPSAVRAKMSVSQKARIARDPEKQAQIIATLHAKYTDKIRGTSWRNKRKTVLARDNYTCRGCGERDKRLLVHHIDMRGRNMPSHRLMNNNVGNLITLCDKCHNGFHRHKAKDYRERTAKHMALS